MAFDSILKNFDQLANYVNSIDESCRMMMEKIEKLKLQTSQFTEETSRINSELKLINENEKTLERFQEEFCLSPNESQSIESDSPIDENFFQILNKIREIHKKSKSILASNQMITGFEIMDLMSKYEEKACDKLYRFTVNILRTTNLDFIELHPQMYDSIAYLQTKDILFKNCLDEYVIIRRSTVTHSFIEALTRGVNAPSNKTNYSAMELYSSDIVRYIRDMLSFLHQTFLFERELLKTLLKKCDQAELNRLSIIKIVISSISEGVIRILKIRIENSLNSFDRIDSVDLQMKRTKNFFQVKNIISFYLQTFNQILSDTSAFIFFMKELLVSSDKVCYNSLKFLCSNIGHQKSDAIPFRATNLKLNSHDHLRSYAQLINDLLESIKSSITANADEQQLETQRILGCIFEPCLQFIFITSSMFSSIEMTIFNLNCFEYLKKTINKFKFTDSFQSNLQNQIDESVEIAINEQFQWFINSLSMNSIYNTLEQTILKQSKIPLSSVSGCDPIAITAFLHSLEKFANNPKQFEMKNFVYISDPSLRKIYDFLIDPVNKYHGIIESIKYKPDELEKILMTAKTDIQK
ncbi:hypothetical protein NH340_JMT01592 [Sarcoptes scabiei]|nr:hypothetical protein NH340_JMT01592 [Sarcoptes scabiei]